VQEAHDLALVAQAATLRTRVPFLHFFDGFRTSHELNTIEMLDNDDLRALIPEELIREHRGRALSPEHPFIRGTAQNPDTYFQARETVNPFYAQLPGVVQDVMDGLADRAGRQYRLVENFGDPEAERMIVLMGSAAETARETAAYLNTQGERVGVLQVRLYRPFPAVALLDAMPACVRAIAVLDRTKEPGSQGEPLFLDVVSAISEAAERQPKVIGGRYGMSSKEFTPGMVAGVFAELARDRPLRRFTIGITDDVSGSSLPVRRVTRHRAVGHCPRHVLRPWLRWHRRREQEHHQDPRLRSGASRSGLFRLRLEEVRLADRVAFAVRVATDQSAVS